MDSWDYKRCLDRLKYKPKQNHRFELRQYEDRTEVLDGPIDANELEQWLDQTNSTKLRSKGEDRPIRAIRILYSYTIAGITRDDSIPWSREDLEKIIKSLRLSPRYTQTLAAEHTIFASFPGEDIGGKTCGLSYIFATRFHFLPFWSMTASYDPVTKTTNALLHCEYSAGFESIGRLKQYVKSMASHMHPMMLPVMIIDMDTTLALGTIANAGSRLRKVEAETGQNALITDEPISFSDPLALDLLSLVNRLSRCSADVRVSEKDSEVVLEHLRLIRRDINEVVSGVAPFLANAYEHLQSSSMQLRRHIDYLISSRKILLLRFQEVQLGSQTQLSVVHNFIAQRDNKLNLTIARSSKTIAMSSKRDSSAMKTLALLTMVFLPGTAIASFFAMPFFNVAVDVTGNALLETRPQFWIYWVITIPLTLFVLGLWIVWLRITARRHEKEDEEALEPTKKGN